MAKKKARRYRGRDVDMHHVLGEGWIHTHGMDRRGLPELEVKGVPGFLAVPAANLIQFVCDYMIESGKVMKAGETMQAAPGIRFRFARPEPTPGDEDHYEVERLRLEDVEATCGCCGMPAGKHG